MHVEGAYEIIKEEGYPEVANVAAAHGFMSEPKTWEEKILNYADKRVKHSEIVSLRERFDDLHERYGPHNVVDYDVELRDEKEKLYFELEKEIFSNLDFKPEDLKEEVEKSG